MADHPLRPANHRSLGRPLPYLLANGTQTPLQAVAYTEATFAYAPYETQEYPVLVPLSVYYSRLEDRLSTRYSPVRHFTQDRSPFRVRLACVKHAASVRSEPGSNSPVNILANHNRLDFIQFKPNKSWPARFTVQFSKIKSAGICLPAAFFILPCFQPAVNNFLICFQPARRSPSLPASNEAPIYRAQH